MEFCNLIFAMNPERRHKFLQNCGAIAPHPANLQHFISALSADNLSLGKVIFHVPGAFHYSFSMSQYAFDQVM